MGENAEMKTGVLKIRGDEDEFFWILEILSL